MFFDLQKANMLKRISAVILDVIVITILATGFGSLISAISGYDTHYQEIDKGFTRYETEYGIRFDITDAELEALSEEERAHYIAANDAIALDDDLNYHYSMMINLTLVILSGGILLAFVVSDIVMPLIFKNGQTIGKKIFSLGLMQTDHTQVRTAALLVRTLIGKFAIDTMIPVLICMMIFFGLIGIGGTIAVLLLLVLQIAVMVYTKTNSAIHDILAMTVVVDLKSQMVFTDNSAKEAYKRKYEQEIREKRGL